VESTIDMSFILLFILSGLIFFSVCFCFHPFCSAKEVDDLLNEVDDLNIAEEKRDGGDKKKEKKKVITHLLIIYSS